MSTSKSLKDFKIHIQLHIYWHTLVVHTYYMYGLHTYILASTITQYSYTSIYYVQRLIQMSEVFIWYRPVQLRGKKSDDVCQTTWACLAKPIQK